MKALAHILFASLFLLMAGCSGIKNSWTNFRAHYNTYYNAEESFKAGQKKVSDQTISIDPDSPIRVHRELPQAGAADFKNTIDKGAQILRKFPNSKWTDDALFLIGKSYYYRDDYYLALEKFEELYDLTANKRLKQEAVLWKGRTLLDLNQPSQGIAYLQEQLTALRDIWNPGLKAELRVLISEHFTMLENWQAAANELMQSVDQLRYNSLKSRAYFLYAQLLEKLGEYDKAFAAFDKVTFIYTDYQYSYWAELNKGKIARRLERYDQSLAIFMAMNRDDKNFEKADEIYFQIARTQQALGEVTDSEIRYKQLLRSTVKQPTAEVQKKTYYQLGIIYSDYYNNFTLSAAYFDSSASISLSGSNSDGSPPLASAYGDYALLRDREISIDSLLALGRLSKQKLDSTLLEIRRKKLQKISSQKESSGNILSNLNQSESDGTNTTTSGADFGFLNYRNPRFSSASKNEFRLIWGDPPLADNWRRAEVVQGNRSSRTSTSSANNTNTINDLGDNELGIDISDIPRSPEAREKVYQDLANVRYQLGNLLFLTLNLPDSAETYFKKVIETNYADEELIAKSKYALYELFKVTGKEDKAAALAEQIIKEHPNTNYTNRITELQGGNEAFAEQQDSTSLLLDKLKEIDDNTDSTLVKLQKYRMLALNNSSSMLAPHIHYKALKGYLELAKNNADSLSYFNYWADSDEGSAINGNSNPFAGTYWDSVRVLVNEQRERFKSQPYEDSISQLDEILSKNNNPGSVLTCAQLGISPKVKPDMDTFLKSIVLPDALKSQRLSGSIEYRLSINRKGEVKDFKLGSASTLKALENSYNTAIKQSLAFFPIAFEKEFDTIQCDISFPVKN